MPSKPELKIGLIGAGFMGRCHANAFRAVGGMFDLPVDLKLEVLADVDDEAAAKNASALGFARSTGQWRELTSAPDVDIVAVAAPNALHEPMALDAIANGKAIYCEKPLATDVAGARRMTEAADAAGAVAMVGFNFLCNPMMALARDLITAGEIGEIVAFRGRHAEDYMANPLTAHSFRTDRSGGGALADIGSHVVSLIRHLIGPVQEVSGNLAAIYRERPVAAGSNDFKPVEVDDMAQAILRFENGASGSIEVNWAAPGRTMDLSFEVTGSRGSLWFTQERMNELWVWMPGVGRGRGGFAKIEAGPEHHPYGRFCPAPGHQLGFNDLKVIEVSRFIEAVTGTGMPMPDFREALRIQETIDAIRESAETRSWTRVRPDG